MEVVIERACGMDIHKDNITACILTSKRKEIQTFSTKTVHLLQLIDWIKQHECTHVAMESTGVFWKPIVNLLEAESIEFLVVNAQHMKALPGRKTDVKDSEWIAKLLRHGLLELALQGYVNPHQRLMIKTILTHIDFLSEQVVVLDQEVAARVESVQEDIERLDSIPGIATRMAEQILAEIGTDIKKQFPSAAHLCSWAGLVPGHNESAGKKKSAKTTNGNKYLKSALVEAAHSVAASKNFLGAMYRRTAARKGKKRAAINVAHAMLKIAFYLLTRKEMYVDLGEDYFDRQKQQSIVKYAVRRLECLGYTVTIASNS